MRKRMATIPFLEYIDLQTAYRACVEKTTQGQDHIKPLHRHFAMRLVLEGGFLPEEVTPHPPFQYRKRGDRHLLELNESLGSKKEQTVIGGVKTKDIDVVVCKTDVGPVVALSFKATQNAFRNLTNRMEEAVGDCTNLHLRYPALVYGFYHVILANRASQIGQHGLVRSPNDVSIADDGKVNSQVGRYVSAIQALSNRKNQWEPPSGYESVAVDFIESAPTIVGQSFESGIDPESSIHRANFMANLLRSYDLRYPFLADSIGRLKRIAWDEKSPLFQAIQNNSNQNLDAALGYSARLAAS
jgi:hypothetical protein